MAQLPATAYRHTWKWQYPPSAPWIFLTESEPTYFVALHNTWVKVGLMWVSAEEYTVDNVSSPYLCHVKIVRVVVIEFHFYISVKNLIRYHQFAIILSPYGMFGLWSATLSFALPSVGKVMSSHIVASWLAHCLARFASIGDHLRGTHLLPHCSWYFFLRIFWACSHASSCSTTSLSLLSIGNWLDPEPIEELNGTLNLWIPTELHVSCILDSYFFAPSIPYWYVPFSNWQHWSDKR